MKLTKQQRILVVILAIFCVVLLCDRFFLLPRSTQAQNDNLAGIPSAALLLEVTDTVDVQSRTSLITQRLQVLWPDEHTQARDLREAFMLPASWPVPVDTQGPDVQGPRPGSAFISQHRLKAVFVDDHHSRVVIDDCVLMIGQTLEGFTLVEVDEGSATFASDQTRFVMRLSHDR